MTQIFIDPTKTNIAVRVLSQSLHSVGFNISIFEADGNTVREQHSGNTKDNNPFSVALNGSAASYKGTFVSGTFAVISPTGNDGPYSILFSVLLDGAIVTPSKPISGNTSGEQDIAIGNFHVN